MTMGLRNVVCAFLLCLAIASTLPGHMTTPTTAAGGSFGGGTGTSTDPYIIEDVEDLQNMSFDLSAYYVLGGDVDASATASWDSGAGFLPVGSTGMPFLGRLNGAGHTVRGLFVNRPAGASAGLFGNVGPTGSVRDVGLVGCNVTGANYVGALVCYNAGSVSGCQASGSVTGNYRTGGLVGWNHDGGTVSGCTASVSVTGHGQSVGGLVGYNRGTVSGCRATGRVESTDFYVGGLAGAVAEGTVTDSHATGDVTGTLHVGGLVGSCTQGTVSGSSATGSVSGTMGVGGLAGTLFFSTVSLSYASGDVTATGDDAGGLAGALGAPDPGDDSVVSDCYATGDVTTTGDVVGGLVGINRATVVHSYSTGSVSRTSGFGGLVGILYGGLVMDSFWDNETSGMDTSDGGEGRNTADMMTGGTFTAGGWDLAEVWFIVEGVTYPCLRWQDAGTPTADAGPDRTVDLDAQGRATVTFDGTASEDDFGHLDHEWTFEDGGPPVSVNGATTDFTYEHPGVHQVTLTVTDPTGHRDTASTTVTVRDVTPPVADAGPDQVVDEDTPVTLDGGGSSDNVGIAEYTWSFEVGGAPTVLHGVAPGHTFDAPGVYTVKLTVSDAAGHSHEDTMALTVRDVTPPSADAGPDRSVPVGSNVTLDASASTDNVGVDGWSWAIAYQGSVRDLEGAVVHFTFDEAGTYEVQLSVEDASGNTAEDTLVITVVGTGTVSGVVLDKGGKPVEGATVELTASDGATRTATTDANGTFGMEVPHGAFEWKVSKKGYKPLSGDGTVDAMGEAELDLAGRPMVKEEKDSPGSGLALVLLAIVGAAVARRRG